MIFDNYEVIDNGEDGNKYQVVIDGKEVRFVIDPYGVYLQQNLHDVEKLKLYLDHVLYWLSDPDFDTVLDRVTEGYYDRSGVRAKWDGGLYTTANLVGHYPNDPDLFPMYILGVEDCSGALIIYPYEIFTVLEKDGQYNQRLS